MPPETVRFLQFEGFKLILQTIITYNAKYIQYVATLQQEIIFHRKAMVYPCLLFTCSQK